MNFILVLTIVVVLGVGSCVGALRSSTDAKTSRGAQLYAAVACVVSLYLSFGLVYSSDTLRWYGAPIPVGAFERVPGGDWVDFVGPLGILVAGPNILFWAGVACAPRSVPYWYRRFASVPWPKAAAVAAAICVVGVAILYVAPAIVEALVPSHVVVLRNRTNQTLRGVGVQCDRSIQYVSKVPPGEERSFTCDGEVSVPEIWQGKTRVGRCHEAANKHNRLVIAVSGSDEYVVQCERSTP